MRQLLVAAATLLASTGCATFSWEGAAGANIQATAYARSTWHDPARPSPVTSQPAAAPVAAPESAAGAPPRVFVPARVVLPLRATTVAMTPRRHGLPIVLAAVP